MAIGIYSGKTAQLNFDVVMSAIADVVYSLQENMKLNYFDCSI